MVTCPHCDQEFDDESLQTHQPRCEIKQAFSLPIPTISHPRQLGIGAQTARARSHTQDAGEPGSKKFLMECTYCNEEFDGLSALLKHRKTCSVLVGIGSEAQPSSSPTSRSPVASPTNVTAESQPIDEFQPPARVTSRSDFVNSHVNSQQTSPADVTFEIPSAQSQDANQFSRPQTATNDSEDSMVPQPAPVAIRSRRSVQEASASRMSLGGVRPPVLPQARKSMALPPPTPLLEGVTILKAIPDQKGSASNTSSHASVSVAPAATVASPAAPASARLSRTPAVGSSASAARKSIGATPPDMLALLKSRQSCPNIVRDATKSSRKSIGASPVPSIPVRQIPAATASPQPRSTTPGRQSGSLSARTSSPTPAPLLSTRSPSFGKKPVPAVGHRTPSSPTSPSQPALQQTLSTVSLPASPSAPQRSSRRSIGTAPGEIRNRLGVLNTAPSRQSVVTSPPVPVVKSASRQSVSSALVTRPSNASL